MRHSGTGQVFLNRPPLSARVEDIGALVEHFARAGLAAGAKGSDVTPAALRLLEAQTWPGNVRELKLTIERALVFASGGELDEAAVRTALALGALVRHNGGVSADG